MSELSTVLLIGTGLLLRSHRLESLLLLYELSADRFLLPRLQVNFDCFLLMRLLLLLVVVIFAAAAAAPASWNDSTEQDLAFP